MSHLPSTIQLSHLLNSCLNLSHKIHDDTKSRFYLKNLRFQTKQKRFVKNLKIQITEQIIKFFKSFIITSQLN